MAEEVPENVSSLTDELQEAYKSGGFSFLAAKRMFFVGPSTVTGTQMCFSSSLMTSTASEHLGALWDTPEAALACRELDACLAPPASADVVANGSDAAPQTALLPLSGVVHDLLHFLPQHLDPHAPVNEFGFRDGVQLKRRTALVAGDNVAAGEQPQEWVEVDPSQPPSALLLTHRFADVPRPGATLTLRTLFLHGQLYEATPQTMLLDVFGQRTPALGAPEYVDTSRYTARR